MHCVKYPRIWVFTGPFSSLCSDVLQDIPRPNLLLLILMISRYFLFYNRHMQVWYMKIPSWLNRKRFHIPKSATREETIHLLIKFFEYNLFRKDFRQVLSNLESQLSNFWRVLTHQKLGNIMNHRLDTPMDVENI